MLISLSKKYLKIKHIIKLSCNWVWNDLMSHQDPISMPHWICNDQCPIPNRTGCCSRRVATSIVGPVRNLKENSLPVKMRMIKFPLPLHSASGSHKSISFSMHLITCLLLNYNWPKILFLLLEYSLMISYFSNIIWNEHSFKNVHHCKSSCHLSLHNYWLYSLHHAFSTYD